jgi:hypothetical protein
VAERRGQVLEQAPAVGDGHELRATADREGRQAALAGAAQQLELPGVGLGVRVLDVLGASP